MLLLLLLLFLNNITSPESVNVSYRDQLFAPFVSLCKTTVFCTGFASGQGPSQGIEGYLGRRHKMWVWESESFKLLPICAKLQSHKDHGAVSTITLSTRRSVVKVQSSSGIPAGRGSRRERAMVRDYCRILCGKRSFVCNNVVLLIWSSWSKQSNTGYCCPRGEWAQSVLCFLSLFLYVAIV